MVKKLICDRCGLELTEPEDVALALEGQQAWAASARARGAEPRGILPCKNYIRCGGEIKPVPGNGVFWWRRWVVTGRSQ